MQMGNKILQRSLNEGHLRFLDFHKKLKLLKKLLCARTLAFDFKWQFKESELFQA